MEWLDVVTNYVSWWDDRKRGNNPQKSLFLTLKTCSRVSRFSHRGGTRNTYSVTMDILNAGIPGFPPFSLYRDIHEIPAV
jgi:hypothetical protein